MALIQRTQNQVFNDEILYDNWEIKENGSNNFEINNNGINAITIVDGTRETTINGDTNINGNLNITGNEDITGNLNITGNLIISNTGSTFLKTKVNDIDGITISQFNGVADIYMGVSDNYTNYMIMQNDSLIFGSGITTFQVTNNVDIQGQLDIWGKARFELSASYIESGVLSLSNDLTGAVIDTTGTNIRLSPNSSEIGAITIDGGGDVRILDSLNIGSDATPTSALEITTVITEGLTNNFLKIATGGGLTHMRFARNGTAADEIMDITKNYMRTGAGFVVEDSGTGSHIIEFGTDGSFTFGTAAAGAGIPVDRMRIDNNGNVGIGSSTPSEKLQVEGNMLVGITGSGEQIKVGDIGFGSFPGLRHADTSSTADYAVAFSSNGQLLLNGTNGNNIHFRNDNNGIGRFTDTGLSIGNFNPSISLAIGDSDTGFDWVSDGIFSVYNNNIETMRFSNNNNVGIGPKLSTEPAALLHIEVDNSVGGAKELLRLAWNDSSASDTQNGDGVKMTFHTGNVNNGLGTLEGAYVAGLKDSGGESSSITRLEFGTYDGTSLEERMRIQNSGQVLIKNKLFVGEGTNYVAPAIALAIGDSDTGLDWVSDGIFTVYNNNNETARFTNGNDMGVGWSLTPNARLHAYHPTDEVCRLESDNLALAADILVCRAKSSNRCIIRGDGDLENINNSYGMLSDLRLKENVVNCNSQWEDIKAIRFVNYNFVEEIDETKIKQLGVIAQELELVSSGLVKTSIDSQEVNGELVENIKSVKGSVMYMKGMKALQEAQLRIEKLENQMNKVLMQNKYLLEKIEKLN